MNKCIIFTISFLCFWNCDARQHGNESHADAVQTVNSSNLSELKTNEHQITSMAPSLKIERHNCLGIGKLKVITYTDGKLESLSHYQNGLVTKHVSFDPETKEPTSEIEYFYKDNGELDYQKAACGKNDGFSEEMLLENRQAQKEIQFQCDYLQSKGIHFPLADIVANDISDLSVIFSWADRNHDFKAETETNGNQKIIEFIGLNKKGRFHNSPIALLIGNGDLINIKDYELRLENGFPLKEIYRTPDGDITKMYSYQKGKLTGIFYQFTDLQNQTNSLKKRFEYQALK